jgi:hypothetical protein
MKIEQALKLYRKVVVIRHHALGEHVYIANALDRIGKCQLKHGGDMEEALRCFSLALKWYRMHGMSEDNPHVIQSLKNISYASSAMVEKDTIYLSRSDLAHLRRY